MSFGIRAPLRNIEARFCTCTKRFVRALLSQVARGLTAGGKFKGCDIGCALVACSREGTYNVDARTVTASCVIATFAAQIPTSPFGAVGFRMLCKLPCQANHSAYFGSAKFYLSRPFSAVDAGEDKYLLQSCQRPFSVQSLQLLNTHSPQPRHSIVNT